ncbi:MAG: RidA family protein [Pseudomonadota bacterium]
MTSQVEQRLSALGITLPDPGAPAGNYVPFVRTGNLVFISGQVSRSSEELLTGKLGSEVSLEEGQAAAKVCGINLIAQLKAACEGDLDRVRRVVKLTGFVNAASDFAQHPSVVNGCSDLMVAAFGDLGRHARAAVGSSSLPMNVSVEVEGVFEIV